MDKLLECKRNWIKHVNRMPRNKLARVMKHYSPTGRRNHGRPLKRLLDTWDRNGSTSDPTAWQIYDDDEFTCWLLCVYIYIYLFIYNIFNIMYIIFNLYYIYNVYYIYILIYYIIYYIYYIIYILYYIYYIIYYIYNISIYLFIT